MTHSYVTWLIHLRILRNWHASFIRVTRPIPMCDMDVCEHFARTTRLIYVWDVIHSYLWRDAFICATWLIHVCGMRHSYMWLDPFLCVTWLIHILDLMYFLRMEWRIQMCSMTHTWKDLAHVIFLIHICDRTHFYAYHGCMWVFCACVWYESI